FFIWSLVDERDQKVPRSGHRAGSEADPSFFFLRRSFFAAPHTRARMRANGGNVLASGLRRPGKSGGTLLLPAFTSGADLAARGDWHWEVVSSDSSATASDSHGIPSNHWLTFDSQRTASRLSAAVRAGKKNFARNSRLI